MGKLHIAALEGNLQKVKKIVENGESSAGNPFSIHLGSEINIKLGEKICSIGDTALDCAIMYGHLEVVIYLHKQGAKGGKNGSLEKAVQLALENKFFDTACYVIFNLELNKLFISELTAKIKELNPTPKIFVRSPNSGDGTSALIKRFIDGSFSLLPDMSTIGANFYVYRKKIFDLDLAFSLWDGGGGQERYDMIMNTYMRESLSIVFCINCANEYNDYSRLNTNIALARESTENSLIFLVITNYDKVKKNPKYHTNIQKT